MPSADRYENDHRDNQIQRRDQRPQQDDQDAEHHQDGRGHDQLKVMVVVVAGVPQRRREPVHRDRGVGECGVGLRRPVRSR